MSGPHRRAARIDKTQNAIVARLRAIGVSVEAIKHPDDLVICHNGETSLAECKTGNEPFTKGQVEFIERWPGKVYVFRSADDAAEQVMARWMK